MRTRHALLPLALLSLALPACDDGSVAALDRAADVDRTGADAEPRRADAAARGGPPGPCSAASTVADACDPPTIAALSVDVDGLPWSAPEAHAGAADCKIQAVDAAATTTTIELECAHSLGSPIDPAVTLTITGAEVDVLPTLHKGRKVRLVGVALVSDEDVASRYYYKLERPGDHALLFAWTDGHGSLVPPAAVLDDLGLTPASWLSPVSADLAGGLCPIEDAYCIGTEERGAIELEVAGREPARILDHRSGAVDGGYVAHVGDLQIFSDPYYCVDNAPRSELLLVATAGCPK